MIAAEFKGNASRMNEILMAISQGRCKRSELASLFDVDISGHLHQLENMYGLIEKVEPLGKNGAKRKRVRYELTDELLDFWYTFCLPNLKMLQSDKTMALRELIKSGYPTWSGRILERLYRRHFRNLGIFTDVGLWWDKNGENEIDLVAVNSVHKRIVFAEVKRNEDKIDLNTLKKKVEAFLTFNPEYASYKQETLALSLKELSADGVLPFLNEAVD